MDIDRIASCDDTITLMTIVDSIVSLISSFPTTPDNKMTSDDQFFFDYVCLYVLSDKTPLYLMLTLSPARLHTS